MYFFIKIYSFNFLLIYIYIYIYKMSVEIEDKFLEVDINDLRSKIKKLGGKKIHKMIM